MDLCAAMKLWTFPIKEAILTLWSNYGGTPILIGKRLTSSEAHMGFL